MSTTTLRVRNAPGFRVDAAQLLPGALAALTVAEIGRVLHPGGVLGVVWSGPKPM